MSVNKVDKTTGELVTLANGTRMWIGTQAAHDAAVAAGTMPNNCMVCITDDAPGADAFNFSTTEVKTPYKWIDNRPIYRKVIDLGTLPDNTTNFINHNIDHLDIVVNMTGMAIGENVFLMLPHTDPTDNAGAINLYVSPTQVGIQTADTRHYYTGYAVLYYVKTTD